MGTQLATVFPGLYIAYAHTNTASARKLMDETRQGRQPLFDRAEKQRFVSCTSVKFEMTLPAEN